LRRCEISLFDLLRTFERGDQNILIIMTDRFIDLFCFSSRQQQSSKTGGSAKQANKENGDSVTDEVRGKLRFRFEKSFVVRMNHIWDWILFTGMGVDVFWNLFFCVRNYFASTPQAKLKSQPVSHPPSQAVKLRQYANGPSIMRKEKRQSSSSFNVSDNREIVKLPPLKGKITQRATPTIFFLILHVLNAPGYSKRVVLERKLLLIQHTNRLPFLFVVFWKVGRKLCLCLVLLHLPTGCFTG